MNRLRALLRSGSGFTFIEIIVAVTILSIIILTLYSLMDVGFSFWDYIDKSRWSYTDIQMVVNKFGEDLRCTFFRPDSTRYPFKGNMYQVEFYTQGTSGEVTKLTYEYSPYDRTLFLLKGKDKIALLTGLERCNLYFYHPDFAYWDNYWDSVDKKRIPSAVKLTFVFQDAKDYEYKYDLPIYIDQKGIGLP